MAASPCFLRVPGFFLRWQSFLLIGNTFAVQVQGKLFEGTGEDTDDLDGQGSLTFQVARADEVM